MRSIGPGRPGRHGQGFGRHPRRPARASRRQSAMQSRDDRRGGSRPVGSLARLTICPSASKMALTGSWCPPRSMAPTCPAPARGCPGPARLAPGRPWPGSSGGAAPLRWSPSLVPSAPPPSVRPSLRYHAPIGRSPLLGDATPANPPGRGAYSVQEAPHLLGAGEGLPSLAEGEQVGVPLFQVAGHQAGQGRQRRRCAPRPRPPSRSAARGPPPPRRRRGSPPGCPAPRSCGRWALPGRRRRRGEVLHGVAGPLGQDAPLVELRRGGGQEVVLIPVEASQGPLDEARSGALHAVPLAPRPFSAPAPARACSWSCSSERR